VCVGTTTTFTTAATGTTNITYQWQISATLAGTYSNIANGSGYSNVTTATLSVNTTGNFGAGFYRCQVNGDFAVTVFTDAVELIINVIPTPPITTSASKCGPGNITLSANGGTAGQYRWYDLATGGAALVGETNTTFTTPSLSATTTYYVAINNGSCESTRTAVTATINAIPLKPTINSTITPSGNNVSVCSSNTLTLTAPPSFNFYAWSNGETTQQIIITSSGTYSVTVDSGNGCSSPSSDDINVTVIPEPCANQPPVFIATQSTATLSGNISIDLASLISDTDNNLDLASLKIVSQPISGAIAEISNTILMIDYSGLSFTGLDKTTIEVCDLLASCTQQDITIEVVGNLIIYSGISPNGDPFNEKWIIQNIESLPDTKVNHVKIYNRWGDLVYETDNYDNDTRAFRGINKNGMEVSSGVYFYKIEFKSGRKMLSGYITVAQ
jgi:gliding motility-associated-like protein